MSWTGAACRADLGGSSRNLCARHKRLEQGFLFIFISGELDGNTRLRPSVLNSDAGRV